MNADPNAGADSSTAAGQSGGDRPFAVDGQTDDDRPSAADTATDDAVADDDAFADDDAAADDGLSSIDAPSPTDRDRRNFAGRVPSLARDRVAVPGLVACVAGLVLAGAVVGLVATTVVVGLWAVASPVYAATAGVLLLGVLVAGGPTAAADGDLWRVGVDAWSTGVSDPAVALVAAGAAWLLLAPAHRDARTGHVIGATLVAGVATVAVAFATLQRASTAVAAVVLAIAVALGCYALHRYSLVRLAYGGSS